MQIVENLVRAGVVERRGKVLATTPLGQNFLSNLHPDCEDQDQSLRLAAWCRLPLGEVLPLIDRYIRTFFGRQKRFLTSKGRLARSTPPL